MGGEAAGAGAEAWLKAAGVLRERARVALAVAAAVEAAGGSEGQGDLVGSLEAIVAQAVSGAGAVSMAAQAPEPRAQAGAGRRASGEDAPAVWRQMQETRLAETALPAVWFASGGAGGTQVTLALGCKANGVKQVLGVWCGGAGEQRCSQSLAADLHGRGLGQGRSWLAVAEGERALDMALRREWGERVMVAHCQEHVGTAVLAHLPASLRATAAAALEAAWEAPAAIAAQRQLLALAESWHEQHPGAASRLRAEVDATTAVTALGLRNGLARRLRSAVPARYLLEQCLPAARGLSGRAATAAVAAAAAQRAQGFRRMCEPGALVVLTRALAEQTGHGALQG